MCAHVYVAQKSFYNHINTILESLKKKMHVYLIFLIDTIQLPLLALVSFQFTVLSNNADWKESFISVIWISNQKTENLSFNWTSYFWTFQIAEILSASHPVVSVLYSEKWTIKISVSEEISALNIHHCSLQLPWNRNETANKCEATVRAPY